MGKDQPIGYTNTVVNLEKGHQRIELVFFGKIFRDKGIIGPYTVEGLRGFRENLPFDPEILAKDPEQVNTYMADVANNPPENVPHEEIIPTYNGIYRTKVYSLEVFSTNEWDSKIKQDRIKWIEEQLKNVED